MPMPAKPEEVNDHEALTQSIAAKPAKWASYILQLDIFRAELQNKGTEAIREHDERVHHLIGVRNY